MIPATAVAGLLLLLLLGPGDVVGSLVGNSLSQRQDLQTSENGHQITQEIQELAERSDTTSQKSLTVRERDHQLPQQAQLLEQRSHPPPQRRDLPHGQLQVFVGRGDLYHHDPLVVRQEPVLHDGPDSAWHRVLKAVAQNAAQLLAGSRVTQHVKVWFSKNEGSGRKHQAGVTSRRREDVARQLSEPWYSVDAWLGAFQSSFKRDLVLNVGKVGAILLLYHLAPDLLVWINENFGLV